MTERNSKEFTTWHEEMISGNYKRSTQNEKDIETLEKVNIQACAEFKALCAKVDALTKVLWGLAGAIILTLVGEIVKNFL